MREWGELADTEKAQAARFFVDHNRNYAVTAEQYKLRDTSNTQRKLRHWARSERIPDSLTPRYVDEVVALSGDVLTIGDLEIPDQDAWVIEKAVTVGDKFGIDQLVINGDLMAMDGFSPYAPLVPRAQGTKDEIKLAVKVLHLLGEVFPSISLLMGNHDRRMMARTFGELSLFDLLELQCPNIKLTPFSQVHLSSGGRDWLICHPDNYAKIPGSVARELAEIHHMNVIAAHTHHLSWSLDKSGTYQCIDGGHCRDADRTLYKTAKVTRHPAWAAGFTTVRNGYGSLFSKTHTDWDNLG